MNAAFAKECHKLTDKTFGNQPRALNGPVSTIRAIPSLTVTYMYKTNGERKQCATIYIRVK